MLLNVKLQELKCLLTNSNNNKALPLADDLSVGFNQIIRHVSARQILQSVFVTDLHLDTETENS